MRAEAIFLAILIGWISSGPLAAQAPAADSAVFRVTSELVLLDAQVINRKTGLPVGSLQPDDFEIYEDGIRQQVASLSRDKLPLSIIFLFDLTDSVQPVLLPLADGAAEALRHLKPEDQTAVMVYQAKAKLLQDFTTDRDLAVAAIRKAGTGRRDSSEPAYFNEGLFQAAVQSRKADNPSSRRVLIWLTDNVPNIPGDAQHTEKEALRETFESGAVVCSLLELSAFSKAMIVFHKRNPMFAPASRKHPPGDVYHYVDQTGGIVLKSSKEEIATRLANLIDQIRNRYTLGYRPSAEKPAGTFCHVEVKLAPAAEQREGRMLIRARQGYYC